ncbi:DNA polymerase III subunit alpha [Bacillus sp. FJAT-27225]|uniref:DNA polymerase III subunit alpha n=1 Tax=Bacillus sp. FJAT-27225 TaxID=1743144 RepID=UPI00080C2560|nr:DNA polymerase III subunit alpha [Bacillus sp. FJAT-27225]OCA91370.1 DNA polymerase III subunit alpha [Bacillus sp. FJAT-27225]
MSFIHLQTYSAYSLLSSTASISGLVANAKKKGYLALALTDRNVLYGAIEFYKECKKNGLKPILGLTVDVLSGRSEGEAYPLVLLAKNKHGFSNLLKISSAVQTKSADGLPMNWLKSYASGLVGLTPGLNGEIESLILDGKDEDAASLARLFAEIFKGEFYLSLQDHGLDQELGLNNRLVQLAAELSIPTVATNSVYYLEKEDSLAHECLLAIRDGAKLQDDDRATLQGEGYYLKDPVEMAKQFSDFPEALENTIEIAGKCSVEFEFGKFHMPKYPLPEGTSPDQELKRICLKGLKERHSTFGGEYQERLRYELAVIKNMNFSDYFLIVWDFMKYARDNGILTGPGRGSAAGSLVAYSLYITDVDPLEHGLLFERFLNPERITMPDIDIDFPDHRRDEVIAYVADKYGELHVAQIATFGTLAAKAALRDVGRAFGLNTKELDQLSKAIPSRNGITLEEAFRESSRLREIVNENPMYQKLFDTAKKLEGLPRHTSTHAAGVVITGSQLVDLIPIQHGHNGVYLTQYSMEHLEEIGMLKMDFLGLRNLSLLETIAASIRKDTGKQLDIKSLPLNDGKTFELLAQGETTGIFQLESEGMRKVLVRLKPTRFEDIVAVNALYRPGPMENIPLFIDRKHGREKTTYPHKVLEPILEPTYGVIVYQEQIMQIASAMAGFSLGEADLLRRAVSKKKKDVLDKEREHFVAGALKKGYNSEAANEVYDLIVRFANYGFNKSHAVAYSIISCQLAYLKAHFPTHFMAGLLTSAIGNDVKIAQYIRELKGLGIEILPPSINKSRYSFHVESGKIRYALGGIKGVGGTVIKDIAEARRAKPFRGLFDFCIRLPKKSASRKTLEALVHSGSFDEFGVDRASLLASIDIAIEHAQLMRPEEDGQAGLFGSEDFMPEPKYMEVDPIRLEDKLAFEKEVLGFYLSSHPLSMHEKALKENGAKFIAELSNRTGFASVGIYVTSSKVIRTKKGEPMSFLTMNDSTGDLEAVAFPDVYRKYSKLLNQGRMAVVEGKTEERNGKLQFMIRSAFDIEEWVAVHQKERLYLRLTAVNQETGRLTELKELLSSNKGTAEVVLHYDGANKTIKLGSAHQVMPTESLLQELKRFLGEENVVLK